MKPGDIVNKMFNNDAFSQWLGIDLISIDKGYCKLSMQVRDDMTNGFNVAHGGISYSLADSALAFASNSQGQHSLSIETSISHTRPIYTGDKLIAEAKELNLSRSLGIYEVTVINQENKTVALFKGTVFRKNVNWE